MDRALELGPFQKVSVAATDPSMVTLLFESSWRPNIRFDG